MSTVPAAPASAVEPFSAVGSEMDRPADVCRCGRGRHPYDPERCAGGHPWRGTPGPALVVGSHSRAFWVAQAQARQAIEDGVFQDAGYTRDDAPEALRLAASSIAQAAIVQQSAFARLVESAGPLTSSGRVRRAFVVWLQASDRVERFARLVGLRRVPRPVDPLEAVREAVARANARVTT